MIWHDSYSELHPYSTAHSDVQKNLDTIPTKHILRQPNKEGNSQYHNFAFHVTKAQSPCISELLHP